MSSSETDIFRMCKDALRGISQLKKTMSINAINDLQHQIDKPRPAAEQPKTTQLVAPTIILPKSMSIPMTLLEQDGDKYGRQGQRRLKRYVHPVNYRESESHTHNEEMEIEEPEQPQKQQTVEKQQEIVPSSKPASKPKIQKVENQKKQVLKKAAKPLKKLLSQTPYPTIQQKIREKFGKPVRRAWIKRRRSSKQKKQPFSWRQVHDSYGNFNPQSKISPVGAEQQQPEEALQHQKIMEEIEQRVLKFVQRQFMIGDKINIKNLQLKADKIAAQYGQRLTGGWLQDFNRKLLVGSYSLVVDLTKG